MSSNPSRSGTIDTLPNVDRVSYAGRMQGRMYKSALSLLAGLAAAGAVYSIGHFGYSRNLSRYLEISEKPPHEINAAEWYAMNFIRQYKYHIIQYSKKHKIPVEYTVTALLQENYKRTLLEDWKDWIAVNFGHDNPSLGPGQINTNTARLLDRKFKGELKSKEELEKLLLDPIINMEYVAMMLSEITGRDNRLPQSLNGIFDPHLVAVTFTEYNIGGTETSLENAKPNARGLESALIMARTDFSGIFEDESRITPEQRRGIEDYVAGHQSNHF